MRLELVVRLGRRERRLLLRGRRRGLGILLLLFLGLLRVGLVLLLQLLERRLVGHHLAGDLVLHEFLGRLAKDTWMLR